MITAGPGSDPHHLPQSINPAADGGHELELVLADGTRVAFAKQGTGSSTESSYKATGAMAGTVYMNTDGSTTSYTYHPLDGGRYIFDSNGNLQSASPSSSNAGQPGFSYTFATGGRISSVTLPESRSVSFSYDGSNNLNQIQEKQGSTVLNTWTPSVGTNGLTSVQDPLGNTVQFGYAAQSDTSTYLTSVQDGGGAADTWQIGYTNPGLGAPISGPQMQVSSVQAPGTYEATAGDPNSATALPPTTFAYSGAYTGRVASSIVVTDPRGNIAGATAANYQTTTQFDTMGFPIEVIGPPNAALGSTNNQPITTMAWDTNGNLLCKRLPPANAQSLTCIDGGQVTGARETDYSYQTSAPFQITSETGPAPNPDATGTRSVTSYNYDENLDGLLQENYQSVGLQGEPLHGVVIQYQPGTYNWGSSPPDGLTQGAWAIRWVGRLTVPSAGPYQFKLFAQGTARLIIDGQVLEDCWTAAKKAFSAYNCGSQSPDTLSLSKGTHTFVMEYKHYSTDSTAQIDLEWDGGNGGAFSSMPASVFDPKLDVLTSSVAPSGSTTSYSYTWGGEYRGLPNEVDVANATGGTLRKETLSYDDYGRVTVDTHASGQTGQWAQTNTYDTGGVPCLSKTVVSQTGEGDQTTTNQCDPTGNVTSTTLSVPAVSGTQQPSADQTSTTQYNALGQVTSVQQTGDANATVTTYTTAGQVKDVTDPLGNKTAYTYTPSGQVLQETDNAAGPTGAQETTSDGYDAAGNQIAVTKQYGTGTKYLWSSGYDAENRLLTTHEPGVSTATNYVYDTAANLDSGENGYLYLTTQVTDPAGVQTTTTQDMTGAVIASQVGTQAGSPEKPTLYQYDPSGHLTQTTDPNGVVTSSAYNDWGEVSSTTEPSGPGGMNETTGYGYDRAGHLTTVNDPYSNATTYVEDAAGNPLSVTLPGAANPTTYTYDGAGQLVATIDPDGRHHDLTYDQLGNLSAKYEYPQGGSMADPSTSWLVTTYGYDQNGEPTSVNRPTGREQCSTYDAFGNTTTRYTVAAGGNCATWAEQDIQTYAYNPLSGMTSAADTSGGQPTLSIAYDPANPTRPQTVSQGSAQTTYAYNAATGRLTSSANTVGSTTNTTQYGYDSSGRISSVTNPFTNQATNYSYSVGGQGTQLASRTDPNGMITNYGYDADGRLANQTSTSGSATLSFGLTYDDLSRILTLNQSYPTVSGQSNPGTGTWHYTYYANSELQSAQLGTGTTTTYQYDGSGNRTHVIVGATDTASTYDGAGRLATTGSTSYTWNTDDQLTNAGTTVYTYDQWGRQQTAKVGTNTITYAYDALDRTQTRTPTTGNATTYTYTGTSQNLSSTTTGSASPVYYAWSMAAPLAQQQAGAARYLIADPHTNLAGIFDTTGAATGTISYDPWGVPSAVGSDATASLLGYQSQPTDPTTGLTDMGARNYDPAQGRFTTEDTVSGNLSNPLSLNQYTYGQDSPIDNTDPNGNMIYCGSSCSHADQETARTYSEISTAHATGVAVPTQWTSALAYETSHYRQINISYRQQVQREQQEAARLMEDASHRPSACDRACSAASVGVGGSMGAAGKWSALKLRQLNAIARSDQEMADLSRGSAGLGAAVAASDAASGADVSSGVASGFGDSFAYGAGRTAGRFAAPVAFGADYYHYSSEGHSRLGSVERAGVNTGIGGIGATAGGFMVVAAGGAVACPETLGVGCVVAGGAVGGAVVVVTADHLISWLH